MTTDLLHELMDRAHVASIHVQLAIDEHPALAAKPEWRPLYEKAVESLEALYQAVGDELAQRP